MRRTAPRTTPVDTAWNVELLARLRALARRESSPRPTVLQIGDLHLDTTHHYAWRGPESIDLSAREVAILEAFMRRPGRILTRDDLLELVWDGDFDHRSDVVDVAVRRLRHKIDRPFGTASIQTVRGAGTGSAPASRARVR